MARTKFLVAAFFVAALLHATLWGMITPLWQIPDEAAHYEYVRLMVKLGRMPRKGDEDPLIQASLLRSMWENHYWEFLGFTRPAQPPTRFLPGGWTSGGAVPDTAVIGDAYIYAFSDLTNAQPVYYALLAPIEWTMLDRPIDEQLQALRAGSRVIFALAVACIVLTSLELFGGNLVLVIGAGLIAVMQPMFVYIGSGLNNDVGVTFMVSLLAWQLASAWRRGFTWWRIGLIVLTSVAAVFTKRTAVFVIAWVPLVITARWLACMDRRGALRILAGGAAAIALVAAVTAVLYFVPGPLPANWNSPSPWQQAWTAQAAHTGSRAFVLQGSGAVEHSIMTNVRRPLGLGDGGQVIFSAWVKAAPAGAGALRIRDNSGNSVEWRFTAGDQWQLVSTTLGLTSSASNLIFSAAGLTPSPIYADDLHATIQTTRTLELPLPNSSAESATPMLAQVILSASHALGVYGQTASALQDYRANLAALPQRAQTALWFVNSSFWGRFGIFARAANPTLPSPSETVLGLLVVAAGVSIVIQFIARRRNAPCRPLLGLFLLGVALLLLQTFAPLLSFAAEGTWLPQGRYLFGGMALMAGLLSFGWLNPLRGKWQWAGLAIVVIILAVVALAAIQVVANYFAL